MPDKVMRNSCALRSLWLGATGLVATVAGAALRIGARSWVWPYSWQGPEWNLEDRTSAYQDIGIVVMVFGLGLLILVAHHGLRRLSHLNRSAG